jgi:hypothetical protein
MEGSRAKRNEEENDTHHSSNTNDPNLIVRAGAVPDEGDEDGDAEIEHAGYVLGNKAVRDGDDSLLVSDGAGGVPVLGAGALRALFGLQTNRRIVSISWYDQV